MGFVVRSYQQHKEVFGIVVPISEIEQSLISFNLTSVMLRLGQINVLLAKSRIEDNFDHIQGFLRADFFDEDTYNRIEETYINRLPHAPVFFTRLQVLALMRM